MERTTQAAWEAVELGYQAIPITPRDKKPVGGGWQNRHWPEGTTADDVEKVFTETGAGLDDELNVGVLLGKVSGNLIDIDLDHPKTVRLKDMFLPPTPARGGRAGKPNTHYWYRAKEGTLGGTRQHLMPRTPDGKRGAVIVEYRSDGAQTVIPPSIHPSGEEYRWTNKPWGGEDGPMEVDGRVLAVQVATLALTVVLLDAWPTAGTRHEAYLALAGGLLRYGDNDVHPYWQQNASVVIRALADATLDDDGADQRESESIGTTIKALKAGTPATGFNHLATILGQNVVDQVRILVAEIEQAAGFTSRQAPTAAQLPSAATTAPEAAKASERLQEAKDARDAQIAAQPMTSRDPLDERLGSWEPLDLEPYLLGQITPVMPSVLQRSDGVFLMYPGRVNMLYGSSESAKSWLALYTCIKEMEKGQRVVYLDFEDEPVNTLARLQLLGADPDDLRFLFTYIRPEDPLAPMQRNRWGQTQISDEGARNYDIFTAAIEKADPAIIVADGMTVLYGLHGLDTNDAVSTDIITSWLKGLTRNGRSTVILIDHTTKGAEKGALPIGSQHKQAMVQGTMIQVWAEQQPMPGRRGELTLLVLKDRPGQVRKESVTTGSGKMQIAARVILDSTVPGTSTMTINAPTLPPTSGNQVQVDLSGQRRAAAASAAAQQTALDLEKVKWSFHGQDGKRMSKLEIMIEIGEAPAGTSTLSQLDKKLVDRWQAMIDVLCDPDRPGGAWLTPHGSTKDRVYELIVGGIYDDGSPLSSVTANAT